MMPPALTRAEFVRQFVEALKAERPHRVRWETAWKQWAVDVVAVADVLRDNEFLSLSGAQYDTLDFIRLCHEGE